MRRHLSWLAVAATLFAMSAAGYAYSTYAKWASPPITFYVNPANADVSSSAAIAAMQVAMGVWNAAGSAFSFQYGGTTTTSTNAYDNRNVILFRNASSGSAIASTYSWWDSSNRLLDSDVIFWDSSFRFYTGTSGCGSVSNSAYVEDIATHELGHALGLNHSSSTDATMYPSYSLCSMAFRTLASDDVNGIRTLYPGGTTNTAPTLTITSPANGASFALGSTLSLVATASDAQDGNLTSSIQWTDNGAPVGSGGVLSKILSVLGVHVLVARVTDSGGLQTSKQVTVTITALPPANTTPTVTISSPANGASFQSGTAITFTGMASDTQDGNLTSSIQWLDNGASLGTGGLVSKPIYTIGTHVITARVTDSGGLTGSGQITVTIIATATGTTGTLGASARAPGSTSYHRVNLAWSGVSGVNVDLYRNGVKALSTLNDGKHMDYPGTQYPASATHAYRVCVTGTATCTNIASVSFY
jgi:hypothetical protein